MKVIYLAHPLGAPTPEGITENLERAKRWYKWCCDTYQEHAFVCNWILNCEVYNDADAADRQKGMERNFAVLGRCDELWLLGGRISQGMKEEAKYTIELGWGFRQVLDLTRMGTEPPNSTDRVTISISPWVNPK